MVNVAYLVTENYECTGGIIFAKSNLEARKTGANLWNDDQLGGMTVKRRKDLDQYEGKGVPAWVLVCEGWRYECFGCGMTISEDDLIDENMRVEGVTGKDCGRVHCSHACRADSLARDAHNKAFGEAFCDMLKDMVRNRMPDIDHYFGEYQPYHYARNGVVLGAAVSFQFPGMKHGPAQLRYRPEGKYGSPLIGPTKPEYSVCNGDREAFEALFSTPPNDIGGG